jgi:hypothetical protein
MTHHFEKRSRQLASLSRACALLSLIAVLIVQGLSTLKRAGDPTIPQDSNFYNYTFTRFEPFSLYADIVFFLGLSFFLTKQSRAPAAFTRFLKSKNLPLAAGLSVLLVTGIGRFAVHQNFDLCIDEYLNEFEAKILAHHHLVATVPVEWRDYEKALDLPYLHYNEDKGYWASEFLPGFASLDLLFDTLHLGWALSPALAAISLLLLAGLANRAFPDQEGLAGGIAVLLLAFCPQFLFMATTKFAWTSHLCGSLLWVWLLTHPDRRFFLLTPVLGVLLIGLHQPHVHLLVAAPFLLRLMFTRDWKAIAWFGFCYLIGCWAWYQVMLVLRPSSHGQVAELHYLSFPLLFSIVVTIFHAITLLAWCTPIAVPFLFIMIGTWKKQPPFIRDSFLAACVTFLFYLSFPHVQGHGWGYRYMQPAYGLLALAAAGGGMALCREGGSSPVLKALLASVLFSVCVQIPYRAHEIRTMVRPLALTSRYLEKQQSNFVILQTSEFWYSWDLIRNDPWLKERPLIFDGSKLSPDQVDALYKRGKVTVIGANEVKPFGVIVSDPSKASSVPK